MAGVLAFVTGNSGKYATARDHLGQFGVEVEQIDLGLTEIQSTSVAEVARHKAIQAFEALNPGFRSQVAAPRRPVLVQDSGFGFEEFGGWPGPMVKHLIEAVGAAGVSHLADLTTGRRCRFASVVVHVDVAGEPHEFTDPGRCGRIAAQPAGPLVAGAWSVLWNVFIADGTDVPMAALAAGDRAALFERWRAESAFAALGRWLTRSGQ
jgi:XTP/dITP diphosphohydrolase